MNNKIPVRFIVLLVLTACASKPIPVLTNAIMPPTATLIPTLIPTITVTSTPTKFSYPTPPLDTPRWVLYERALSYIFLGPAGITIPDMSTDNGLCEWEIMGQKGNEVYVYATCQVHNPNGTGSGGPAVIRLGKDGTILEVEMPNEGWGNLKELFPQDIVTLILKNDFHGRQTWDRIQQRQKDSSILPLIVEQGTPMP